MAAIERVFVEDIRMGDNVAAKSAGTFRTVVGVERVNSWVKLTYAGAVDLVPRHTLWWREV